MSDIGARSRAHELSSLLLERAPDGGYAIGDRPARALLCLLGFALARVDAEAELPRFLMEQLGAFAREAGIEQHPAEAQAAVLERFLLAQMPPELQASVERFFREELAAGDGGRARKLAAALGLAPRAGALDSGARPAGTTAAGPLARFQLDKKSR